MVLEADVLNKKPVLIVEGNIGAGKSTFLKIIGKALNAQIVCEPVHKWQNVSGENLLERFYTETQRWAYSFQTYAFVTRVTAQEEHARVNDKPMQVLERSVYSDRYCFAQNCFELGYINKLEWELYCDWFSWLVEQYTPRPDAFIYLQTDPKVCHKRLLKRSRTEEVSVGMDYLHLLHRKHEDWLIHRKDISPRLRETSVIVLPCNEDFENNPEIQRAHIAAITEFLNAKYNMPENIILNPQSCERHSLRI